MSGPRSRRLQRDIRITITGAMLEQAAPVIMKNRHLVEASVMRQRAGLPHLGNLREVIMVLHRAPLYAVEAAPPLVAVSSLPFQLHSGHLRYSPRIRRLTQRQWGKACAPASVCNTVRM